MSINPEKLEQMINREYLKVINPKSSETAIVVASMRMAELIAMRSKATVARMERDKWLDLRSAP